MDTIALGGIGASKQQDGVIVDSKSGAVKGYWACFGAKGAFMGIPAEVLMDVVAPLRAGTGLPTYSCLGARLEYVGLSQLRDLGLPATTAKQIEDRADHAGRRRQAVMVARRWGDTDAMTQLQDGDVILAIDGTPIISVRDVDLAVAGLPRPVEIELFREGKLLTRTLQTFEASQGKPFPSDRMVLWAGCGLQEPPPMAKWLWSLSNRFGVFVSVIAQGGGCACLPARPPRPCLQHRDRCGDLERVGGGGTFLCGIGGVILLSPPLFAGPAYPLANRPAPLTSPTPPHPTPRGPPWTQARRVGTTTCARAA